MILDEHIPDPEEEIILSDREIFTKIWLSPRMVFKYLNDFKYEKYVNVLLILAGIGSAFDRASANSMGDNVPLFVILISGVVLGGILGWITYYIYAALMSWTGKWLDGKGNTNALLRMMAHAMIPSIVAIFVLFPQLAFFGMEVFQSEVSIYEGDVLPEIIWYTTLFIESALGLWTMVLLVIGISEVQKFSIGKSILNMILPGFIIFVPIFLIVLLLMI